MGVKIKIDTTKSVIKQLEQFEKSMFVGTEWLRGKILSNWKRVRGADNKPFSELSPEYAEHKAQSGREAKRNLLFSGLMIQGFKVFKKSSTRFILGFVAPERKKARGNVSKAPGMLDVSDRLAKDTARVVEKSFWSKVK